MSSLIQSTLGKYHLVEQIGHGGMAKVYKAYHPGLDRFVAVKVMHVPSAGYEDFVTRFKREAVTVARLHHAHIVQIYDFDTADGLYYLVMELIDGSTLDHKLQEDLDSSQPISIEGVSDIFNQLAEAVSYAHERGVIHRDLKPSNIMFRSNGQVVLTDFGIARLEDVTDYTASGALIGTYSYMSPEQCRSQPVDARSDIYSLGVILYEMITGRRPFVADQPIMLLNKHISEEPPPPTRFNPQIPEDVERVVLKSLHKSPEERYQTAVEMAQALHRAITQKTEGDKGPSVTIGSIDRFVPFHVPVSTPTQVITSREPGVSHELMNDLRTVLLDCDPFSNDQKLRALFAYPQLRIWRNEVPQVNNIDERVDFVIAFLQERYNIAGENALVLFMKVLLDRISPQDMRWQRLAALLSQMDSSWSPRTDNTFIKPGNNVSILVYNKPGVFEKPAQLFGREALLDEIRPLLNAPQYLLLHGMGGCGKTSLAATLADDMLNEGKHPVIWIQAGYADSDAIIDALVDELGADRQEKQVMRSAVGNKKLKKLQDLLGKQKTCLLILDDVWQEDALKILKAAPKNTAVIVTSRYRFARLHVIDVDDLSPDAALDLLAHHANQPTLRLDPAASELCKLLSYHAYALEIAGNLLQVDRLTPQELIKQIAAAPHKIVLERGDGADRESVAALLESSYRALSSLEKRVFRAFGNLFAPGATPMLLRHLLPDKLNIDQALTQLVRRNLLKRRSAGENGIEYYEVHDLTFHYIKEKARHVKGGKDEGSGITAVQKYLIKHAQDFDHLALDMDNILGAARGAATTNPECLVQLISWLCVGGYPSPQGPSYLDNRGHSPLLMLGLLNKAIEMAGQMGLKETQHYLWGKCGNVYYDRGDLEKGLAAFKESLALAPNLHRRLILMAVIGKVFGELGRDKEAATFLQDAYTQAKTAEDDGALSYILETLSFWAASRKDFKAARRFAAESVELARRQEDNEMLGYSLLNLGSAERELGNVNEALSFHQEALAIAQEGGFQVLEALLMQATGEDRYRLGQIAETKACFNQAIALHTQTGGEKNITYILQFCKENNVQLQED